MNTTNNKIYLERIVIFKNAITIKIKDKGIVIRGCLYIT